MEKITIKSIKFNGNFANIKDSKGRDLSGNIEWFPELKDLKENSEVDAEIIDKNGKLYVQKPKGEKKFGFKDTRKETALQCAVQFLSAKVPKSEKDITADHVLVLAEKFMDFLKK